MPLPDRNSADEVVRQTQTGLCPAPVRKQTLLSGYGFNPASSRFAAADSTHACQGQSHQCQRVGLWHLVVATAIAWWQRASIEGDVVKSNLVEGFTKIDGFASAGKNETGQSEIAKSSGRIAVAPQVKLAGESNAAQQASAAIDICIHIHIGISHSAIKKRNAGIESGSVIQEGGLRTVKKKQDCAG